MSDAALSPGRQRLPFSARTLVAVGVAVCLAIGGVLWITAPKSSETTDAAYVQADSSVIAPKIRGLVARVLVAHNQPVHRGDAVLEIDPEEFTARVAAAEADLATAEAGVLAARAARVALDAEEQLARANIRVAQAAIGSADAQANRAEADRARFEQLAPTGAVSARDTDTVRAAAVSAASERDRVRAGLDAVRDQAGVIRARRATLEAAEAQAGAARARATAALALARQDLDHTVIRAPIDGVVGDRQVAPGDYVQPGTRLLTVAPLSALYLTANFKETQVMRMVPGQAVRIRLDALPGTVLTGRVDSLAPGTGSQFSLLPFEPGTGNFTKIVQRVPVRIAFDPGQTAVATLRPGLSAQVTVRLRD
jgi:membrane fusion protein (multidrug efflux system)